jgi:hypothetical protein
LTHIFSYTLVRLSFNWNLACAISCWMLQLQPRSILEYLRSNHS